MKRFVIFVIFVISLAGLASAYNYADSTAPGFVQIHIFANPAQDNTVWVVNDLQNITFDSRFDYEGSEIVGQNPGVTAIEIPKDGVWKDYWQAGNYTAYLQNGKGNQLETIRFRIGGGDTTYVNFIGAAYTMEGKTGQVQPTPTVTRTPVVTPTIVPTTSPTVTTIPTTMPTPTPTPTVTTVPTTTATPKPTITATPKPTKCKPKHWWNFWDFETECAPC